MKKPYRMSPRQLLISILLLLLFTLLVCLPFSPKWDQAKFKKFSEELYIQEMSSNTLSLHYSLADPAAFGITDYSVTLPLLTPGSEEMRPAYLKKLLERLHQIHRSNLPTEESYAYDCLEHELLLSQDLAWFPYFSDPLSPTQGIQCQLPILFSEYQFRSLRDVEEYLTLLSQTGLFFDSLIAYEQQKAARGLLMALPSLQKLEEQCYTIVTSDDLKSGEHFLQTSFRERLEELSHEIPLSEELQKDYIARNNAILTDILAPSYQSLKQGMKALETYAPAETGGLCRWPGGKEYYRLLLEQETGSSKAPEELHSLLEQKLASETSAIRKLSEDYPSCLENLRADSHQDLGLDDPYQILEDLKNRIAEDFPTLTSVGAFPQVTVKTVSPSLQSSSAPAFYLTSPIDGTERNVIYVNPQSTSSSLELYTTLAHEGFPGHLYQNAYTASHLLSLPESRLRQLISCGGYLEGWALYVEQRSHDYASRLLASQNRPADAVCVQIEKHHRSLMLCLYSLLDLMIHYEDATPEEIAAYLAPFGVEDSPAVQRLYDYICETPCNYPKYYVGCLEILELKQIAEELWSEDYTDLDFHTFLLKWGPADYSSLNEMLCHGTANIAIQNHDSPTKKAIFNKLSLQTRNFHGMVNFNSNMCNADIAIDPR